MTETVDPKTINCVIAATTADAQAIVHLFRIAPRNDIRYYINGVYIDGNRAVATNGHMLGTCSLDPLERPTAILLRLSKHGRRWLKKHWQDVTSVGLDDGRVAFYSDGCLKLIDAEQAIVCPSKYPDYRAVIGETLGAESLAKGFGEMRVQPKYLRRAMPASLVTWGGSAIFHVQADPKSAVFSQRSGNVVMMNDRFVHVIKPLHFVDKDRSDELLASARAEFPKAKAPTPVEATGEAA